jgi:chromosome segregation ATPase
MRSLLHQLTYALALALLLWLTATAAQQPAPARQKAPRLTTDDVVRPPAEQPSAESKEAAAKPEDAAKVDPTEPKSGQPKATEVKVSNEESSWRERVGKARNRAKYLERAAEEAELRITALRNELGTSGQSARYRNDTAAELDQAGQRLSELRAQARTAADDAAQLVEYGKQKGFNESEEPKPTAEEGKPNEEYYRTQFTKLTEALESAQRRIQLYDNRVRDLNQQISTNSGGKDKNGRSTGGDSFFALQLQKDRDEAQQKLDEARAAQTQAQADLDALREEARRAGVPPGLFR